MWPFLGGFMLGGCLGVLVMALAQLAGRSDAMAAERAEAGDATAQARAAGAWRNGRRV